MNHFIASSTLLCEVTNRFADILTVDHMCHVGDLSEWA